MLRVGVSQFSLFIILYYFLLIGLLSARTALECKQESDHVTGDYRSYSSEHQSPSEVFESLAFWKSSQDQGFGGTEEAFYLDHFQPGNALLEQGIYLRDVTNNSNHLYPYLATFVVIAFLVTVFVIIFIYSGDVEG